MSYANQSLLNILPDGSEILDVYTDDIDEDILLVKYSLKGNISVGEIKRLNINNLISFKKGNYIYLSDGLTINDLYDIYSNRHNLNLIKDEDYESDDSLVTKIETVYLPIKKLSLRFLPTTISIEIVDPRQVLINDENTRNLTGIDINPFKESLEKELFKLGTILFNGVNFTCFNKNLLTLDFRNFIISKISEESKFKNTISTEILTSKVINYTNDGVSDVIFLSGISNIIFLIRFISKSNDIPILL